MSRPNITIPTSFGGVKADFDNNHLTNGFPQLTPDVLPGDCLNKFIDDTYKGLNGVLELYNDLNGKADVDLSNLNTTGQGILDNKANISLSNVNNTAKVLMSRMGMPSNKYKNLTLNASGSTYTAPANGWFYLEGGATSGNKFLSLGCNNMNVIGISISGIANTAVILPVKKNDKVTSFYTVNTDISFRFIYAVGSESEAS